MSLEVWLRRGKTVSIGDRELILMPLPLSRLVDIAHWIEKNSNDVVSDIIEELKTGKEAPNPLGLVTKVLLKVNSSEVALELFCRTKNPNTKQLLNADLDKEFFDQYLDAPTLRELLTKFIEVNDLPELIKNLWSLPAVKTLIEAALSTYGIPYLSFLQQNTDSAQKKSEGSLSHKSTDMSQPATSEKPDPGIFQSPMTNLDQSQKMAQEKPKDYIQ